MSRPSKPMPKNTNSRFTTRNNKQYIFSKLVKASKTKNESSTQTDEIITSSIEKSNIIERS